MIASAQSNLGAAFLAEHKYDEADHELIEADTVLAADRGPQHEKSLLTARRLAELYDATGRTTDAKRFRELSLQAPPPQSPWREKPVALASRAAVRRVVAKLPAHSQRPTARTSDPL